ARISGVLEALAAIGRTPPPEHLLGVVIAWDATWRDIADDPGPFLRLGLCSPDWLDQNIAALIGAADAAPLAGDALIHLDVRSDNLCFRDDRALLIDWNHAGVGNAAIDVAFWLPSLQAEGGPPPEHILPNAP